MSFLSKNISFFIFSYEIANMRYSVLFFVLVNGIIRDSAITSTKATTTPEPTTITTTSSTTGTTAAPEATSTSELTSITTKTTPSRTTVATPDSTTISELTSIPTPSSATTQASGTTSAETSLQTTKKPTTALKVTTTESTATTSGTMAAAKTTTATTTTEDTTIISETISKITKNSTLTTVGPTSTDNSSTKPISTTNQNVTEATKPEPNTTTSDLSTVTETTTITDQQGSHSTTVTVLNESTTTEINTTDSRDTTISSSDSSTSIATSTKQPDTTTKYPGETKDLSSLRINIDLQISLSNATYNESLADRSSDIYIEYERSFRTMLYETYKDITGFNHVVINNFSNGSVVCNYTVVVNADSNITYIADRIADASETLNFTNSSLKIFDAHFKMYVDKEIVNASIQKVKGGYICNLIHRACETFEDCSPSPPSKIHCTHKCYSGENVCHNGGSCFYDARKKSMECKCTKDNDYIYYGPICIQKAEKFALHKNDIIGLAAGCGGGVVVILLVVIIVLLKKKTRKGKESDLKLDLSREVSIEDIRLHRLSESHSSNGFQNRFEPRAKPNPYETRIPETKFLHGRAHDIYKDSTGEETYIYPSPNYIHPISASGHRDSTKSGQSMYDYIDTESRFEIQRPRIRLGQSSAF